MIVMNIISLHSWMIHSPEVVGVCVCLWRSASGWDKETTSFFYTCNGILSICMSLSNNVVPPYTCRWNSLWRVFFWRAWFIQRELAVVSCSCTRALGSDVRTAHSCRFIPLSTAFFLRTSHACAHNIYIHGSHVQTYTALLSPNAPLCLPFLSFSTVIKSSISQGLPWNAAACKSISSCNIMHTTGHR